MPQQYVNLNDIRVLLREYIRRDSKIGVFIETLVTKGQLILDATTGTPPLVVSSTSMVANLNADMLDGYHASDFVRTADIISDIVLESVDDRVAALIKNAGGILWTYDDVANTLTPQVDHGTVGGLTDDDHPQYIRVDGLRAFLENQTFNKNAIVNQTLQTQAFKMAPGAVTGYVLRCDAVGVGTWQPATVGAHADLSGLGADDHTQYARLDGARPFTGDQVFSAGVTVAGLLELATVKMTTGAASGKVLTVDAFGNATWQFTATNSHSALSNLTSDDHPQYIFNNGRPGGQFVRGGSAAAGNLTLSSTNDAVKGYIFLGSQAAYDEANMRLGVGTATPTQTLDVRGVAKVSGFIMTTGASAGYFLASDGSGVGTWTAVAPGAGDHGGLTGLVDDDHLQYALLAGRSGGQTLIGGTGASEGLTLKATADPTVGTITAASKISIEHGLAKTAAALVVPSGFIGIGTSTPSSILDISGGPAGYTGTAILHRINAVQSSWEVSEAGGYSTHGTISNHPFYITTFNGAGAVKFDPSGNVLLETGMLGIGTATPTSAITIQHSGIIPAIEFHNISNKISLIMEVDNGNSGFNGTNAGDLVIMNSSSNTQRIWLGNPARSPRLVIGEYTWINHRVAVGEGISIAVSPLNDLNIEGNMAIGDSYGRLQTAPANGLLVEGNVGIGKVSPAFPLDVHGTVAMSGFSMTNAAVNGYVLTTNALGVGTWQPSAAGGVGGSGTAERIAKFSAATTLADSPISVSGLFTAVDNRLAATTGSAGLGYTFVGYPTVGMGITTATPAGASAPSLKVGGPNMSLVLTGNSTSTLELTGNTVYAIQPDTASPVRYYTGAAASPTLSVTTDTDTGFGFGAANIALIAAGGIDIARFSTTGLGINKAATQALDVAGTVFASGVLVGTATVPFRGGGFEGAVAASGVILNAGTLEGPSLRWNDAFGNLGLYHVSGNVLAMETSGADRFRFSASGLELQMTGSAQQAAISRITDNGTGVFWPGSPAVGVALTVTNAEQLRATTTGVGIRKTPTVALDVGGEIAASGVTSAGNVSAAASLLGAELFLSEGNYSNSYNGTQFTGLHLSNGYQVGWTGNGASQASSLLFSHYGSTASFSPQITLHRGRGTSSAALAVQAGDSILSLAGTGRTGPSSSATVGSIELTAFQTPLSATAIPGKMSFFVGNNVSGTTERLTIHPSGYLGVNNASPAAPLDLIGSGVVHGNVLITGSLIVPTTAVSGYFLGTDGAGVATWKTGGVLAIGNAVGTGQSGSVLFVNAATNLDQDNTHLNFKQPSGWFGVNTIPNGAPLHVVQPLIGERVALFESVAPNDDVNYWIEQAQGTTTDAIQKAIWQRTIPDSHTYLVEARVIGRRTGGVAGATGDSGVYLIRAAAKRNGGAAAGVGSTPILVDFSSEDQNFDATFGVVGNDIRLLVTGATNNNITWHATMFFHKLST